MKLICQGEGVNGNAYATGSLRVLPDPAQTDVVQPGEVVYFPTLMGDALLPIYNAIRNGAVGLMRAPSRRDHGSIAANELGVPEVHVSDDTQLLQYGAKDVTLENGGIYAGKSEVQQRRVPDGSIATQHKIKINLGFPEALEKYPSLAEQADGVAFARMEFMLLDILDGMHPVKYLQKHGMELYVDRIAEKMRPIVESFGKHGKEVWFRTNDFSPELLLKLDGGELYERPEANPYLGWRGIRRSNADPDWALPEFRAVKKLLDEGYRNIGLFPPMTTFPQEYRQWKEAAEGEGLADKVKYGLMVETPAAALTIDEFVKDIDFVVFGSNDLTQFTLAVDRSNPQLGSLFDEKRSAVLKLFEMVITSCQKHGVETSLGGAAGNDEELLATLFNYGMNGTSVNPDPWTVAKIKEFAREKEQG